MSKKVLISYCEGHKFITGCIHDWRYNKVICLHCGKEIKPEESDWKLKTKIIDNV